jgi:hypothetical protein
MRTGIVDWRGVSRFVLFALTGAAFFAYWALAHPAGEMTTSMREWPRVLAFSAVLLSLTIAVPLFGRFVGGRLVGRWADVAGAGAGLSSIANVFEDGFGIDAAFFAFILGTLIVNIALLALAITIARSMPGRYGLLAAIPAGTMVGILWFVTVGGPLMLLTWLGAASGTAMLSRRRRRREPPTPSLAAW